jgi:hypothetical protein
MPRPVAATIEGSRALEFTSSDQQLWERKQEGPGWIVILGDFGLGPSEICTCAYGEFQLIQICWPVDLCRAAHAIIKYSPHIILINYRSSAVQMLFRL